MLNVRCWSFSGRFRGSRREVIREFSPRRTGSGGGTRQALVVGESALPPHEPERRAPPRLVGATEIQLAEAVLGAPFPSPVQGAEGRLGYSLPCPLLHCLEERELHRI